MKFKVLAIAASMLATAPAFAADFVNGDFETGPHSDPSSNTLVTPSGWTVSPGGSTPNDILALTESDYLNCCGAANTSGNHIVGFGAGQAANISTLSQIVALGNGRKNLSFDFGTFGPATQLLTVSVVDSLSNVVFTDTVGTAGTSDFATLFANYSFDFSSAAGAHTFNFSVDPGTINYDGVLDNVSVAAVPEPAVWAFMILGFGFIGGAMRSTKRAAKVSFA